MRVQLAVAERARDGPVAADDEGRLRSIGRNREGDRGAALERRPQLVREVGDAREDQSRLASTAHPGGDGPFSRDADVDDRRSGAGREQRPGSGGDLLVHAAAKQLARAISVFVESEQLAATSASEAAVLGDAHQHSPDVALLPSPDVACQVVERSFGHGQTLVSF